jgi:hypothetical protein
VRAGGLGGDEPCLPDLPVRHPRRHERLYQLPRPWPRAPAPEPPRLRRESARPATSVAQVPNGRLGAHSRTNASRVMHSGVMARRPDVPRRRTLALRQHLPLPVREFAGTADPCCRVIRTVALEDRQAWTARNRLDGAQQGCSSGSRGIAAGLGEKPGGGPRSTRRSRSTWRAAAGPAALPARSNGRQELPQLCGPADQVRAGAAYARVHGRFDADAAAFARRSARAVRRRDAARRWEAAWRRLQRRACEMGGQRSPDCLQSAQPNRNLDCGSRLRVMLPVRAAGHPST